MKLREYNRELGTVTISITEYDTLRDRDFLLDCLEGGGVDNWSGYEGALEYYNENEA